MKSIDVSNCDQTLQILLKNLHHETITITENGVPVASLTKYGGDSVNLIGSLEGKIKVHGDIFSTGIHYPRDCHKYNRDKDQP